MVGLERLAQVCAAVGVPVVSIGGISTANAGETIRSGCAGAAVVSALFAAPDVAQATALLLANVDAALLERQQASGGSSASLVVDAREGTGTKV